MENNNTNNNQYQSVNQVTGHCFSESQLTQKNGLSANVTTMDFFKLQCLSFLCLIPIVGSLAYIVILFVLAFGNSTALSLKNSIRAQLIWALVSLGVGIILVIVLLSVFASAFFGAYSFR